MQMITVKSSIRDYNVYFPESADFIKTFTGLGDSVFVIDSNVWRIHGNGLLKPLQTDDIVVFPVSEESKELRSVEDLYNNFMDRSAKKNMTMVSIGGGILQDITGFAASTLYRGINWVFLPTTLLAQSDSCIGSKTSLNFKRFKNLIGTFYPPKEVHIYGPFLDTLNDVDFYSGLGEVVKLHIMGGPNTTRELIALFGRILQRESQALAQCVHNSLRIKLTYIENDELDTGRRNLLNFGHCFGHAIETVSKYSIPHGQAVVIGMVFANIASKNRRKLASEQAEFLFENLLFNTIKEKGRKSDYDPDLLLDSFKKDKKRIGRGLVLVIMKNDYSFEKVTDFNEEEFKAALDELVQILKIV